VDREFLKRLSGPPPFARIAGQPPSADGGLVAVRRQFTDTPVSLTAS
jgi:hypothetical protein